MSARAIRRLREERDEKQQEEDNSSTVDDDDDDHAGGGGGAFAMMLNDDDSDSSSSSDNDDETNDNVETKEKLVEGDEVAVVSSSVDNAEKKVTTQEEETSKHVQAVADDEDKEEDVDALIEEFKEKDEKIGTASGDEMDGDKKVAALQEGMFYEIVSHLDPRDLDVEHVMRTSLLGTNSSEGDSIDLQEQQQQSRTRRNRQTFLFGTPRDDWVRPPHYVGGGIGMTTYDRDDKYTIPWPYNNTTTTSINKQDYWFHFVYADNIHRDFADFQQIQQSGNVNALVLFVAHHPYLPEALLQLAMMLYQINRSQEGLMFLKRCLWVYECGSIKNFTPHFATCFMDYHTLENSTYFLALFRLAQVNNMAGMPRASFAISRYLLSLDPLRDPTGILLALDHYALACNITTYDQWLVNLVECQKIKIYYHDDDESENYYNQSATTTTTTETSATNSNNDEDCCCCDLLELPNWAYSYALALFRLQQQQQQQDSVNNHDNDDDMKTNNNNNKANQFLQLAMSRFPTIVELLLKANDVDTTTGRSFRMDWPSVIGYISIRSNYLEQLWSETSQQDTVVRVATLQASELVIRIFVQQNHKLWAGNDIQQWLFDNLQELHKNNYIMNNNNDNNVTSTTDNYSNNNKPLSPCIRRYGISDPSDYQNRFDLLPPEANPLDPGLLAHAMAVDPNRRRFLRGQQQQRGPAADNFFDEINALQQQQQGMTLLGPPTNNIDPDWPILEILWRSLLPWNRVEGVPRPRR